MSLCINPKCPRPDHPGNDPARYCASCGSDLLINGRYRVLRLLSDKTGFGKIYEAYEHTTPKILKVLKETWNTESKIVALFEQEATVLGKLNHAGIPMVDDYFQHPVNPQGWTVSPLVHCLAMEKVDGVNLEEWMAQQGNQPISQSLALSWLKQVVNVLDVVHTNHYFHRDIKPANIMLNRFGQLVLIDFGTARDITHTYMEKQRLGGLVTAVVSAGFTPQEQINGQAVPQSDFFALGRTFVQLLTGKHPLELYDAQDEELRWRDYTTHVSPLLLDLIDRLMARLSSNRPANTQTLMQDIVNLETQLSSSDTNSPSNSTSQTTGHSTVNPPNPNPKPLKTALIPGIAGLLILAGLLYSATVGLPSIDDRPPVPTPSVDTSPTDNPGNRNIGSDADEDNPDPDAEQNEPYNPDADNNSADNPDEPYDPSENDTFVRSNPDELNLLHTLSDHDDDVIALALLNDGEALLSGDATGMLKVWDLETGDVRNTLPPEEPGQYDIAFSPDGKTIVYENLLIDVDTRDSIRSFSQPTWDGDAPIALSPTRSLLALGNGEELEIWDTDEERKVDTLKYDDLIAAVAFSADGKTLISADGSGTISVWDVDTADRINQFSTNHDISAIAISDDRQRIVINDDTTVVVLEDEDEIRQSPVGNDDEILSVAISPDGRTIASGSADGTIKVWRLE